MSSGLESRSSPPSTESGRRTCSIWMGARRPHRPLGALIRSRQIALVDSVFIHRRDQQVGFRLPHIPRRGQGRWGCGSFRWRRILLSTGGSEMKARTTIAAWHWGHSRASRENTRLSNCAHFRCARPRRGGVEQEVACWPAAWGPVAFAAEAGASSGSPADGWAGGCGRSFLHRERLARMPWYLIM